jgi:hypothetical protein
MDTLNPVLEKEACGYFELDLTRPNLTTYTSNVILLDEFFKIQNLKDNLKSNEITQIF